MLSCINGATTMPYPLNEDIRAAAAAGFQAVELWYRKFPDYLKDHIVADLARLMKQHRIKAATICPLFVQFGDEAEPARKAVDEAARMAAELECPTLLICVRQPPDGLSRAEQIELAARETGLAADAAAPYGVSLAVEPLGRNALVPGPNEALEIVRKAGRPNLGIMMDTFHYYKSGVSMADIASVPVEKVLIIHVNDSDDLPREVLRDSNRRYPTLGVIPAAEMLRPLIRGGYDGALSVEIFREEYWQRPIDEISVQSKLHLDKLIAQLGGN
jgi:2-keto-myo-inositol isomerase